MEKILINSLFKLTFPTTNFWGPDLNLKGDCLIKITILNNCNIASDTI